MRSFAQIAVIGLALAASNVVAAPIENDMDMIESLAVRGHSSSKEKDTKKSKGTEKKKETPKISSPAFVGSSNPGVGPSGGSTQKHVKKPGDLYFKPGRRDLSEIIEALEARDLYEIIEDLEARGHSSSKEKDTKKDAKKEKKKETPKISSPAFVGSSNPGVGPSGGSTQKHVKKPGDLYFKPGRRDLFEILEARGHSSSKEKDTKKDSKKEKKKETPKISSPAFVGSSNPGVGPSGGSTQKHVKKPGDLYFKPGRRDLSEIIEDLEARDLYEIIEDLEARGHSSSKEKDTKKDSKKEKKKETPKISSPAFVGSSNPGVGPSGGSTQKHVKKPGDLYFKPGRRDLLELLVRELMIDELD